MTNLIERPTEATTEIIDRETEIARQALRIEALETELREARWQALLTKPVLVTGLRQLGRLIGLIDLAAIIAGPIAIVIFVLGAVFGTSITWHTVGTVVGIELLFALSVPITLPYLWFVTKLNKRVRAAREVAVTE